MMAAASSRRLVLACSLLLPLTGCGKAENAPEDGVKLPTVTTASGVEMVQIPAGSFVMGGNGPADEPPFHEVWLDSFWKDRHEVTQAEYEKVGAKEAFPNTSHFRGADLPVEQITWPQAARFCNARSRLEELKPCYNEDTGECDFSAAGYRLPTEAEWEYACRAGTATAYSFGNDQRALGDYAWYAENSAKKTHPVGQKRPNAWGLFDMHGNVAEWCQDGYYKGYYQVSPEKNPHGPADAKEYVLRGGSWKSTAEAVRSPARLGESPGFSDACLARDAIGFRCVRKAEN